ncbi:MAG: excinuclease ABC subunit [Beijerinckiaceae bacterium]|nr:MAG: excinuclease ABC subunit [Beijerinckiaceae bacterium]
MCGPYAVPAGVAVRWRTFEKCCSGIVPAPLRFAREPLSVEDMTPRPKPPGSTAVPEPEVFDDAVEGDDDASEGEGVAVGEPEAEIEATPQRLASGMAVIRTFWETLPGSPGVYRMFNQEGEVLYVGKARNLKARVSTYARGDAPNNRIARMIAETAGMEFVITTTETEALLLETNLIKQLKPRYNVLMRDDKSFPYILIAGDHAAPQILKHRGARNRKGDYFGPFAAAQAVNRTLNALQRAFLLRTCTDSYYENRSRPCLLHQIKRCSAPCTGEISLADYALLVDEAKAFLSGKSGTIRAKLGAEMMAAAEELDFERAAQLRDRISGLSTVQANQDINPAGVEEADVFAVHADAGQFCIEVFFFRTGQNWGNKAYFPRADKALEPAEVLDSFLGQFYDERPAPRLVMLSEDVENRALLAEALSIRAGHKVEILVPKRGEKREAGYGAACAHQCARSLRAPPRGDRKPGEIARRRCRRIRARCATAPDRCLRQFPHLGHECRRRDDRCRRARLLENPLPDVQHPVDRDHARR